MSRAGRFAIGFVVAIGGAVLMSFEVAAFRVIGRAYGTALQETTAVIAVFLAAMSIGYYLGGRMADRRPGVSTLAYTLLAASPLTLLSVRLDEMLTASIANSSLPPALHAFAATTIVFALPTILLASISPIAVRLLAVETAEAGRVAGGVSALSTVGSIAGTVLTAFLILDLVGSIRLTILLLAAVTLSLALILALVFAPRRPKAWLGAPALLGVATSFAIAAMIIMPLAKSTAARTSAHGRVIFERDTPYHHVKVTERPPGVRDLYIDATLQSNLRIGDPQLRGLPYEEYKHFAKVVRPGIRSILVLGMGGGTSARQFLGYYPEVSIDAVEIDPVVAEVAVRFFDIRPSERLRLHVGDGRAFLRRSEKRYDMITVDVYTRGRYGSTIPSHMVTREFFQEASARLTDGGILHFHSYHGRDQLFTRALYKTMAGVFPTVVMLGETELIASASPLHVEPEDLLARAAAIRQKLPDFDRRLATLGTVPPPVHDVPLLTDDFAPVDTLLRGARVLH